MVKKFSYALRRVSTNGKQRTATARLRAATARIRRPPVRTFVRNVRRLLLPFLHTSYTLLTPFAWRQGKNAIRTLTKAGRSHSDGVVCACHMFRPMYAKHQARPLIHAEPSSMCNAYVILTGDGGEYPSRLSGKHSQKRKWHTSMASLLYCCDVECYKNNGWRGFGRMGCGISACVCYSAMPNTARTAQRQRANKPSTRTGGRA